MPGLAPRGWLSAASAEVIGATVEGIVSDLAAPDLDAVDRRLHALVEENRRIHDHDCLNLNPAANVMNPRAEALLSAGLGSRPSLGHPGDKYETGLEAIEQIEIIAASLAAEVFRAPYVEIRVGSGAMANLYAFMACASPGAALIAPPATIAGHITHHRAGAAGLLGLEVHEAPIDPDRYTIDVAGLRRLAHRVRPAVITIGGSLNLCHHPVAEAREIADETGAVLVFDAAHLSGLIAGGAWPNPLDEGAHVMTMSCYKSLAGPPSGLLLTTDAGIAERVDRIAYPGLTANFDVARSAALAVTLLDWLHCGREYAATMCEVADALASALLDRDAPVVTTAEGPTRSHAIAIDARRCGSEGTPTDGDALARRLRRANLLASAIGLPDDPTAGLRLGVNEMVRRGLGPDHVEALADLLVRSIRAAGSDEFDAIATEVTEFRRAAVGVHFVRSGVGPA